jgi:glycosyltransferase involved in cell wall biosynthesis
MKLIKVLHFIDTLSTGGKERQLVELLKGLSKHQDISLTLVVMSKDIHFPDIHKLNVNIQFLIRKSQNDPRIFAKLYKLCKCFRPDIIHSWNAMTSVYAIPVAKKLGIKFVNGIIRDATKRRLFDKIYLCAKSTFLFSDAIVANSMAGLQAYKVPPHKSVCIHNGFDLQRTANLQNEKELVREKFHISTDKVVGMVAEFSNRKDYKTYIAAAEMVLAEKNNVTFMAVGDGKNLEQTKKTLSQHSKNKIIFTEQQKDTESIVNTFTIGILTTNFDNHAEGISNSIMEYMALGKPVIATDSGGTKELVLNNITGFLVPPGDPVTLSERISQLLDDVELATKMGMEGKKRIEEE